MEGAERYSSLDAARHAKMMKSVARLLYARRDRSEGPATFRPVFRLTQGKNVEDVDVIRE